MDILQGQRTEAQLQLHQEPEEGPKLGGRAEAGQGQRRTAGTARPEPDVLPRSAGRALRRQTAGDR